ncbi:MAG TPA: hypothetical protein VFI93_09590 [Rhizomicrobium sp.]|nr:hypothetical protein [Rhizomicrobium sp.]
MTVTVGAMAITIVMGGMTVIVMIAERIAGIIAVHKLHFFGGRIFAAVRLT